jgi:pyruvate dehydrogenase E1 component beta subunit
MDQLSYGAALRAGFCWLMKNHPEVFVIGQGLWSPWYVGNSMTDLDKEFGRNRIIDSPVSESSITGVAVGAALSGKKPIIVHPRMDFMLYSMDAIVNQAAKWRHMMGGGVSVPLTVRAIVNRGGEQGAQHSQSLHSWFAHIPGLRVVMPASVSDARDLLIASVLSQDPVVFIDDRWLYDTECGVKPMQKPLVLADEGPKLIRKGKDITLIATSYSVFLAKKAAEILSKCGVDAEVIDIRVLSPLKTDVILQSVKKTGRTLCIDGGWSACGFSSEILAVLAESLPPSAWKASPKRLTLPFAPAPSSSALEAEYYPDANDIFHTVMNNFFKNDK